MIKSKVSDFKLGWFVGNFEPSLLKSPDFEICVKYFSKGDTEERHYQRVATEITVLVKGEARIGDAYLSAGDIIQIEPFEVADFEALSEVALVAIKFPSIPSDKVVV